MIRLKKKIEIMKKQLIYQNKHLMKDGVETGKEKFKEIKINYMRFLYLIN